MVIIFGNYASKLQNPSSYPHEKTLQCNFNFFEYWNKKKPYFSSSDNLVSESKILKSSNHANRHADRQTDDTQS
jgi:hypothetical protein